jgi:hypothetical protein
MGIKFQVGQASKYSFLNFFIFCSNKQMKGVVIGIVLTCSCLSDALSMHHFCSKGLHRTLIRAGPNCLNLPQLQNFRSVVPNPWNKLLSQGMNAKDPHTKEWVWNLLAYAKDAAKGSAVPASILIGAYQLSTVSTSIDRLRESLHQSFDQIKGPGLVLTTCSIIQAAPSIASTLQVRAHNGA